MVRVNMNWEPGYLVETGVPGRFAKGTQGNDVIRGGKWGDMLAGGGGDDYFVFSSDLDGNGPESGLRAKVYGNGNRVDDFGDRDLGRNFANGDPDAWSIPGEKFNEVGYDVVEGGAGVWCVDIDYAAFHGRGDPRNPMIMTDFDQREGDKIEFAHELGMRIDNIKFSGGVHRVPGDDWMELASLYLHGKSANPSSPNAVIQLDWRDGDYSGDRRGPDVPMRIYDRDGDGDFRDDVRDMVHRGDNGPNPWIVDAL